MLTLGGELDPGKTPEVAASAGPKGFGPPRAQAVGDKVLAVFEREGTSYRVADDFPTYMPEVAGRRTPICVVNGFADPKVGKAIIELHDLATRTRSRNARVRTGQARHRGTPTNGVPGRVLGNRQRSVSRDYKSARRRQLQRPSSPAGNPQRRLRRFTNSTVACRPATSLGRHWSPRLSARIGAAAAHGSLQGYRRVRVSKRQIALHA